LALGAGPAPAWRGRRPGVLRWVGQATGGCSRAFVDRAGHNTYTPAELLSALQTLVRRLDTGRWEGDDPAALNAQAVALGPELNVLTTGVPQPLPTPPGFVDSQPAPFLRPWDARCLPGVPVAPVTGELGPVCL
jgi:hypothetical protein